MRKLNIPYVFNLVILSKLKRRFLQVFKEPPPFYWQQSPERNILRHSRKVILKLEQ